MEIKKVYSMTYSDKEIYFIPKNININFINYKNYFVVQDNNFIYVNNYKRNNRKKYYINNNKVVKFGKFNKQFKFNKRKIYKINKKKFKMINNNHNNRLENNKNF